MLGTMRAAARSISLILASWGLAQAQTVTPPAGLSENDLGYDARIDVKKSLAEFEPIRLETTKSLVRVRVYHRIETLFADGRVAASTEAEMPTLPGIVIDALPIVAISAAHTHDYIGADRIGNPLGPRERPPQISSKYARTVGPLYEALLPSGQRVQLVVKERSRPLNLLFLGLADPSAPPEELRHPLEFAASARRFTERELMGGVVFKNAMTSDITVVLLTALRAGAGQFTRPASLTVGGSHAGIPLLSTRGEWLGIVNMQPPEIGIMQPRVAKPAAEEISIDRDPREWMTGYLNPVMMSAAEMAPEIARVREALTPEREVPGFGVAVRDRAGKVEISRCDPQLFVSDPPARAGDVITRLGDQTIRTTFEFEKALESALNASSARPQGEFMRGDQRIPFEIAVP